MRVSSTTAGNAHTNNGQNAQQVQDTVAEEQKEATDQSQKDATAKESTGETIEENIEEEEAPLAAAAMAEQKQSSRLPILFAVLAGMGILLAAGVLGFSKKKNK